MFVQKDDGDHAALNENRMNFPQMIYNIKISLSIKLVIN